MRNFNPTHKGQQVLMRLFSAFPVSTRRRDPATRIPVAFSLLSGMPSVKRIKFPSQRKTTPGSNRTPENFGPSGPFPPLKVFLFLDNSVWPPPSASRSPVELLDLRDNWELSFLKQRGKIQAHISPETILLAADFSRFEASLVEGERESIFPPMTDRHASAPCLVGSGRTLVSINTHRHDITVSLSYPHI